MTTPLKTGNSSLEKLPNHCTDEVSGNIEGTAILIIVLSQKYLDSKRCQTERERFLKRVNQENGVYSQVFVVELEKLDDSERPQEFRYFKNVYRLYDDKEYYNQFDDLKRELANTLKHLKALAERPDDEKEKATDSRPTIFLAEVTDDLRERWEQVKRALDQEKFSVLPETPLTLGESEVFRQAVSKELEQCEVFVQLLSELSGRTLPDEPETTYARLQCEQARSAGKTILQWRDPKLDVSRIANNAHQMLLESAIAQNFEEFMQEVIRTVKRISVQISAKQCSSKAYVVLNANIKDELLAKQIQEVSKKYPVHSGLLLSTKYSEELEEHLNICRGLMVVYGEAPVHWVNIQLRRYIEFEQIRKPLNTALYEGPPEPKDEPNIWVSGIHICNCQKGLDEKELQAFFDKLNAGESL